ncbi:MAG: RNase adapter RapZ [Alphaproteobacteria bacterium]|nr:RNase adapter RapZ [Alphaproteobacteria bacterium]
MKSTLTIIITGMSGAGRSSTLKYFEDEGFEAVDNLPLSFLERLVLASQNEKKPTRGIAIGLDVRTRDFSAAEFLGLADGLRAKGARLHLLFLDCDDDALQRRFNATRRSHPLALDRDIRDGIQTEREIMEPVKMRADTVIDTTDLPMPDLRERLQALFPGGEGVFHIRAQSFSYRGGVPRESDMVFDARFLKNPHYDPALRDFTGKDAPIADFIRKDTMYAPFFVNMTTLLTPLLPRYREEGKHYLTLSVGCTGGRHRSVFIVQELRQWLKSQNYAVSVRHRELEKASAAET